MNVAESLVQVLPAARRRQIPERRLEKDEMLFRRGEAPRAMYLVVSGEVRLTRTSGSGVDLVFQRTRNGFVSEASLFQSMYHCDAIVAEPTNVMALPIHLVREGMADPVFRDFWLKTLCGELRRARNQTERLGLRNAQDRVLHFVETEGQDGVLTLGYSKKVWAAELGLSHEALYRTLRTMVDNGRILIEGRSVRARVERD